MKKTLILSALAMASSLALAQNAPQSNTAGEGATIDQQIIGDTYANADRTNSQATQIGNSTSAIGNDLGNKNDVRNQNTVDAKGGAATGGASSAIGNHSDNKSSVGNTTASNGPQTMGQANTGNSASNSGGNILGGATSGGNVLTNGSNSVKDAGNSSIHGNTLKGGEGGAASANGTNLGINGQQQGIADSGNSKNDLTNKVTDSGNSSNNNSLKGGDQKNAQGQGQGQQQANSSKNEVKGEQKQSTDASTRSGSDNTIALGIDASDRSSTSFTDNSRTIFIPPVVPPTPASTLAVGNIVKETTACGPLQAVVKTPVNGKFFGLFGTDDVPQGFTYDLAPVLDAQGRPVTYTEVPLADGSGYRLIGSQATILAAIIGTSGARNLALGGGSGQGSWGQGGGGTSSSNQQLVTNIQLRACDVGTMKYVTKAVAAPVAAPLPVIDKAPE